MSNKVLSADNQQERLIKPLNPWYIVGFTEGEGTFHIAFYPDKKMKFGIKIIPAFHINQSYLRISTLKKIKNYFGCGYLKPNHSKNIKDDTYVYVVRNRQDLLTKIIPFFEKYPLISGKQKTFNYFKKVVNLLNQKMDKRTVIKIIDLSYKTNEEGKYRKRNKKELLALLESSETIR